MPDRLSTASLDYLQRVPLALAPLEPSPHVTVAQADTRQLLRVAGVGRTGRPETAPAPGPLPVKFPTADLVVGLHTHKIALAFEVRGAPDGVRIHLGTWNPAAQQAAPGLADRRASVVASLLYGLYPSLRLETCEPEPRGWERGGLALGVPAVRPPAAGDEQAPLDQVVRAMGGKHWSVLVLAQPVAEQTTAQLRHQVINEMRSAETSSGPDSPPGPLVSHYLEMLAALLASLTEGQALGAWRTAVYLLGDRDTYYHLASTWRGVFSDPDSRLEPVQVAPLDSAGSLAADWALPDAAGPDGPGLYGRLFEYQSVLTSAQLAAYVHLPDKETPGFSVESVPSFDVVADREGAEGPRIDVGRIVHQGRPTEARYEVGLRSMNRHAFVSGVTGAGKTNTVFHLLASAEEQGIPFLVLEPAKAEYRALLTHAGLGGRVRVFTVGDEAVAPLRLNPFEVPEGTPVGVHLDLLRSAFTASFGMWTPLPAILERCLHLAYADRGWDVAANRNPRLDGADDRAMAFPTLAELIARTESEIADLGYDDEVTSNIRAALTTRLQALQVGGKGLLLDVQRSTPTEALFGGPAVVELERLGDDEDKALVMGLLLIRLAEHRRAKGQSDDLEHVVVVEEAHRLLANTQRGAEHEADAVQSAVGTFVNLLAEVRAYGQGVLIADQVPVKLAPEVIKNTNLKIAHRLVAADDREAVGASMAMDEHDHRFLATLGVGQAAAFSDGDDVPILVGVPHAKASEAPGDPEVAERMAPFQRAEGLLAFHPDPDCAASCAGAPRECERARRLLADPVVRRTLARTVLSLVDDPAALDRMWGDLRGTVRARLAARSEETALMRAVCGHGAAWFARRRGAQAGWAYRDEAALGRLLRTALLEKADRPDRADEGSEARRAFREHARGLHHRAVEPYPACADVCAQEPPVCLYRSAVGDLVDSRRFARFWGDADRRADPDERRRALWRLCESAAYELIEHPEGDWPREARDGVAASARRVGLCFAQQMLAADDGKHPRTARLQIADLVAAHGPEREGESGQDAREQAR